MSTVTKYTTPNAAGAEVDRRAERHAAETKCEYRESVHAVLAADKQLAEAYAMPSSRVSPKPLWSRPAAPAPVPVVEGPPAGVEVDQRVQALIAEHPHLDYYEAMGVVLQDNPALKTAYARS